MRQRLSPYRSFLLNCAALLLVCGGLYSQDEVRNVRVNLSYSCIMPETSMLTIAARFRGEDGFEPASNLGFEVFNVHANDSLVALGSITTDNDGVAVFYLEETGVHYADSTGAYNYMVSSLDHPLYASVEKSIEVRKARLDAFISRQDDIHFLTAALSDASTGNPIADVPLKVQVQRLFRPMGIGDEFNMTDEDGNIEVPIESGIPGLNGNITLEVVLSDNEPYGTVMAQVEAPLGEPITDRSTFDQRTMWSPPGRTPWFLLTLPNLIILGIWGTIVLLIVNLFKIYKS